MYKMQLSIWCLQKLVINLMGQSVQTHVSIDDDRADDGSEEAHSVGDGVEDPQEGTGVVGRQVGDGQLPIKANR